MSEDAIARFEGLLERFNAGDVDSIRDGIARQFYAYEPEPDEPSADEVFSTILMDLKAALPDLTITADGLATRDGVIRGRISLRGTQSSDLWGASAIGNRLDCAVDVVIKPMSDRFAIAFENLPVPEALGILRQLELVNPPDQMDRPPTHPVEIPEPLLQIMFNGQAGPKPCSHFGMIKVTEPTVFVCEQCVASGDIWPALRMCLTCGFVGCCDTSKNKHMKQHSDAEGHPIFRSIRLNESWCFCYADGGFIPSRKLNAFRAEGVPPGS